MAAHPSPTFSALLANANRTHTPRAPTAPGEGTPGACRADRDWSKGIETRPANELAAVLKSGALRENSVRAKGLVSKMSLL